MRRYFLLILLTVITTTSYGSEGITVLSDKISNTIADKKAKVGVAIIYDGKDTITVNNGYRYPTMSVYKFFQALAVMDYLDTNNLPLSTEILITKTDLLPNTHSPLRDKYKDQDDIKMSISDLLSYSVSESDNNVCDILFKYLGGTKYVNSYIKSLGINDIHIEATEAEMNLHEQNQYLNWTNPLAAAKALDIFLSKKIFSSEYELVLKQKLIETSTGTNKIKAHLPKDVIVGHKTGSSSRDELGVKIADNDLGFILLPNNKRYCIAIFVMNSEEDDETNASIIADISKTVYDYYVKIEDNN